MAEQIIGVGRCRREIPVPGALGLNGAGGYEGSFFPRMIRRCFGILEKLSGIRPADPEYGAGLEFQADVGFFLLLLRYTDPTERKYFWFEYDGAMVLSYEG